jgi:hypothetical protein
MRMKDIKDVRDLREMNSNDVIELLDELRAIASKRGTELLAQGRTQARRAIGAPGEGAVSTAFVVGIVLGALAAAVMTLLMSPMPGPEARRKLSEQVEKVREKMPVRPDGNGRSRAYERVTPTAEVETTGGSLATPTA